MTKTLNEYFGDVILAGGGDLDEYRWDRPSDLIVKCWKRGVPPKITNWLCGVVMYRYIPIRIFFAVRKYLNK